jgi:hypothetical protein
VAIKNEKLLIEEESLKEQLHQQAQGNEQAVGSGETSEFGAFFIFHSLARLNFEAMLQAALRSDNL